MCGQAAKFTLEIHQRLLQALGRDIVRPSGHPSTYLTSIYFIHPYIHLHYLLVFVYFWLISFSSPLCFSQFHYEFWRSVSICWALTLFFSNSWVAMVTLCLRPQGAIYFHFKFICVRISGGSSTCQETVWGHRLQKSTLLTLWSTPLVHLYLWFRKFYPSSLAKKPQSFYTTSPQLLLKCWNRIRCCQSSTWSTTLIVSKSLPSIWSQRWLLRPQWENYFL